MTSNNFTKLATSQPLFDQQDHEHMMKICQSVPGYSNTKQYSFFRSVFSCTDLRSVLILGVYFGRDIVFMLESARRSGCSVTITGVDKFSNDACADWLEANRDHTWEEAGFGTAPNLEAAKHYIAPFKDKIIIDLVKQHDEVFLLACRQKFDLIYIDTSHDYDTVRRQLRQALPLLADDGLLAGDDYSDEGTWGVRKAVTEAAPGHLVFADWIWVATREMILPAPADRRANPISI